MIKINLLPVAERREYRGIGELILGVFIILAVLAVIFATHLLQDRKLGEVQAKTKQTERRIAQLEKVKEQVEEFKKKNKELARRIDVINVLEQNRTGPLFVMDSLANAIPSRAWIDDFTEKGNAAKMEGVAWDEFTVADFMEALQKSPYFTNVELGVMKKTNMREKDLSSFVIEAKLNYSGETKKPEESEKQETKPKGAKKR